MSETNLAAALGRVPSGLFVLTIRHGEKETGMLASWVTQAGFEPPMVSVAVKRGRYVEEWLTAGAAFVLNQLAADQKGMLSHFGRGFEPGEAAFEGLDVKRGKSGTPILADALGHLECRPKGHVDSGDHRVFLAEVEGGDVAGQGEPYIHVRKNGLRY